MMNEDKPDLKVIEFPKTKLITTLPNDTDDLGDVIKNYYGAQNVIVLLDYKESGCKYKGGLYNLEAIPSEGLYLDKAYEMLGRGAAALTDGSINEDEDD